MKKTTALILGLVLGLCQSTAIFAASEKACTSQCANMTLTPNTTQTALVGEREYYFARVTVPTGCGATSGSRIFFDFETLTPGLQVQQVNFGNANIEVSVSQLAHQVSQFRIRARVVGPPPFERGIGSACRTVTLNVPDGVDPSPDLVTESIQVPSGDLYADESFTVFGQIRNIGVSRASGSFQNRLRLNNNSQGTRTCSNLDPGASCSPSWSISAPAGFHEIKICADDSSSINESNEGNNCRSRFVTINERPLPDLLIRPIVVDPSSPQVGEETNITLRVDNIGSATANSFVLRLTTPSGVQNATCSSLSQGSFCTKTFSWIPAAEGSARLIAEADPGGFIAEESEFNNFTDRFVTVEPVEALPDLYFHVNGVTMSPSAPEVGDLITFTFVMHNGGEGIFGEPAAEMYISGSGANEYFECTEGLPNAGDCERTWSVVAEESGVKTITATADPFDEIEEAGEDNNSRSLNYVVAGASTNITCQGTWHLTGINGTELSTSSQGSIVDDCHVYFGQNTPTSCFHTSGPGDLDAVWHRQAGQQCPSTATVTGPAGEVWEYSVSIQ